MPRVKKGVILVGTLSLLTLWSIFSVKEHLEQRKVEYKPVFNVEENTEPFNFNEVTKPDTLSENEILSEEIEFMGNIPHSKDSAYNFSISGNIFDWAKAQGKKKCGTRPKLVDIEISNEHWQVMRIKTGLVYIYGAYLDTRPEQPVVRILINSEVYWNISDPDSFQTPNFCQFWYTNVQNPIVTKVARLDAAWFFKWGVRGRYHPYLLTCNLPRQDRDTTPVAPYEIPESVSLVEDMCDSAKNDVEVNYNVPEVQEDFGVCVKGLDMPTDDMSVRMVQWIEMLRILGAKGIHFHKFNIHPNTEKVLKYYEDRGIVTVKPFSLPGFQPNLPVVLDQYLYSRGNLGPKRRQEVIPYNDCFMTHMYTYKYIAILDIDEVIMPVDVPTWTELVEDLESKQKSSTSYCFSMIFFVDRIIKGNETLAIAPDISNQVPGYPYMMNKLNYELQTVCGGGGGFKCLHNTEKVLLVHNHFPRVCVAKGNCNIRVNKSFAYVHHHKEYCGKDDHKGNKTVSPNHFGYDSRIRLYKDELISRSEEVLRDVGL